MSRMDGVEKKVVESMGKLDKTDPNMPVDQRKLPVAARVYGVLCIIFGAATMLLYLLVLIGLVAVAVSGDDLEMSVSSNVILAVDVVFSFAISIMLILLGARLVRNKRHNAAKQANWIALGMTVTIVCEIMLQGVDHNLLISLGILVFYIALATYLDPSLSEERRLRRALRKMDDRAAVEDGTLGRDASGKGYITLNFYNIFWIFVVCCIIGIAVETVYFYVMEGYYQNRSGMLFGPFSPIYGFGGVLMTMALNRFHDKNPILIFLVSALIGGAFEFFVSWFFQFAFGITAWDYSGTWLSIDGRTNGFYMIMWGLLGVVWIKFLLPLMLKLVNLIPWNWRYVVTYVCATFMIVDGLMTMQAFDFWYSRESGHEPSGSVEVFYAEHFGDEWMANHFQTMTINPDDSARLDG